MGRTLRCRTAIGPWALANHVSSIGEDIDSTAFLEGQGSNERAPAFGGQMFFLEALYVTSDKDS